MKDKIWPYEATLNVTTNEQELVIDGAGDAGLLGVWVEMLSHDEGKLAGATILDLQFKLVPAEQNDLAGPIQYQSPYAEVLEGAYGGVALRGNALRLGFMLRPQEKLSVYYKSAATAGPTSVRLRLRRTKCFDRARWDALRS